MGPYDNEKRKYMNPPGFEAGHWYTDGKTLWIVPNAEAEIEGPDGDIEDRLNTVYREAPSFDAVDPYAVASELDLEVVPASLKRFEPDLGFYVA